MKLQKATTAHKKRIMELIDEAKAFLKASGVCRSMARWLP